MSGNESSSSEDLPLSALATKKQKESSDEAEFDNEDADEDMEAGAEEHDSSDFIDDEDDDGGDDNENDGDYASDSSDDVPLKSLKSKNKAASPKKAKAKKAAPRKKAAASAKKRKSTTTKKSPKAKAKPSSSSSAGNWLCASGELYAHCDKGKLIQSILARWWYAYQWPDPKALPAYTPKGYDALDGFPGVYICTQGSNVGKFLDKRDHTQAPSFQNFARKSSMELKETLLKAIEEQLKVLIEHEGKGTTTEKELKVLKIWANKLNCSKADKQAEKVLKAKRLVLA